MGKTGVGSFRVYIRFQHTNGLRTSRWRRERREWKKKKNEIFLRTRYRPPLRGEHRLIATAIYTRWFPGGGEVAHSHILTKYTLIYHSFDWGKSSIIVAPGQTVYDDDDDDSPGDKIPITQCPINQTLFNRPGNWSDLVGRNEPRNESAHATVSESLCDTRLRIYTEYTDSGKPLFHCRHGKVLITLSGVCV